MRIFFVPSVLFYSGIIEYTMASVMICDNFASYSSPTDSNCFESEDDTQTPSDIIRSWGLTCEEYNSYTEDGYRINLVRAYDNIHQNTPLVFGHGVAANSLTFIAGGKKSPVYHYAQKGFDIWIINFRGTVYSRGHRNMTTNDNEYWNFSFHEMAIYDLKSTMELVNRKTGKKALYIGFSMGTTISYIYSIKLRNHAQRTLVGIISLAPVAYLNPIRSVLQYLTPLVPILRPFVYFTTHGEVLPQSSLPKYLCTIYPWQMYLCSFIRGLVFGLDFKQIDPLLVRLIYITIMDSIGAEVIVHYSQIISSDKFQEKDFGTKENIVKYGQVKPPLYDLSQISVPVALLIGKNDWIATSESAARMYKELPSENRCGYKIFDYPDYTHNDIVEATDVLNITFPPLTQSIEKILHGNCLDNEL